MFDHLSTPEFLEVLERLAQKAQNPEVVSVLYSCYKRIDELQNELTYLEQKVLDLTEKEQ